MARAPISRVLFIGFLKGLMVVKMLGVVINNSAILLRKTDIQNILSGINAYSKFLLLIPP
jgi:hypothetical protein